jgi:pimeloyl-ACP methyl ester carboxylesterase
VGAERVLRHRQPDWPGRHGALNQITVPTLITSGRYDEATPAQMQILHNGIAGSRWVVFERSAHLALIEEPDRYLAVPEEFLDTAEATNAA